MTLQQLVEFIDDQIIQFEKLESLKDAKRAFFDTLRLTFQATIQKLRQHPHVAQKSLEEFEEAYKKLMKLEPCGSGNKVYWTFQTKQQLMDLVTPLREVKTYLSEQAAEAEEKRHGNWVRRIFEKGAESKWSMSNPFLYIPVTIALIILTFVLAIIFTGGE